MKAKQVKPTCPAWPNCACILKGRRDIDCQWPYGSSVIDSETRALNREEYRKRELGLADQIHKETGGGKHE